MSEKSRVNNQLKRSNGILTEQDLKNAYLYFEGLCPYSDTPISFELPGGVKNGATLADVEAAYGKPEDENDI